MNRSEARRIIRNRHGEMAALARRLTVSQQFVADVIDGVRPVRKGKKSELILGAAIERATELAAEKKRALAAEIEERACA